MCYLNSFFTSVGYQRFARQFSAGAPEVNMALKKSQKHLYDYLKARVYSGTLNVPNEKHHSLPNKMFQLEFPNTKLKYIKDLEEQKLLKDKLTKTFFAVAPVPKSLKLAQGNPIVAQELDLINHVVGYLDPSDGNIFAIMTFSTWDVDKNYDSFPVDGLEWLNIAGKIANELASTDAEACAIWRDFQYQLIYHLSQGGAQRTGKAKVIYISFGVVEEKHRAKYKNTLATTGVRFITHGMPEDHYITALTTLRGHRKHMSTYQVDGLHELCYIPYADLTFARGGKMVFEEVVDMEGLALHGCEGKKP